MSSRSQGQRAKIERQWYPDEELRQLRAAFHRMVLRGDYDPYLYDLVQRRKMELAKQPEAK